MLIQRTIKTHLLELLGHFPVVGLIGPRQVGKTTLIKNLLSELEKNYIYLDLELDSDFKKLDEQELFLKQHEDKIVIIDEVQRKKSLFPLFRALIDQKRIPARFLVSGSASPELIRDTSESLAGRIAYIELPPFRLSEIINLFQYQDLWAKGGFPEGLLIKSDNIRKKWMGNFVRTYIERDLPLLGLKVQPLQIERLWRIIASLNGQLLNYAEISKSLGISSNMVKSYIDFMENAFLVKRLYPYSRNLKKRLVKSPKIYIQDTGILHYLLNINNLNELFGHIAAGNSWESFVIQQIIRELNEDFEFYFYRTHNGAELDLIIVKGITPFATVEIKLSSTPSLNKGNLIAADDLKTEYNYIITPESDDYLIKNNFRVCSLEKFLFYYIPYLKKINI